MVLLYEQAYGGNQIPEPFSAHNSTHRPNLAFITFLSLCTVKSKLKLPNEENKQSYNCWIKQGFSVHQNMFPEATVMKCISTGFPKTHVGTSSSVGPFYNPSKSNQIKIFIFLFVAVYTQDIYDAHIYRLL